jgi:hypothetical protein
MTLLAALLLLISTFDDTFKHAGDTDTMRPDNLQQLYAWAESCLASMVRTFPVAKNRRNPN